jgi:hypothetical protein
MRRVVVSALFVCLLGCSSFAQTTQPDIQKPSNAKPAEAIAKPLPAGGVDIAPDPAPDPWAEMQAELDALPVLQKTTFYRAISADVVKNHPSVARRFCEVTGTLCFNANTQVGDAEFLQDLATIVRLVPEAKVGFTFSPWHKFLENEPDWNGCRCGDPQLWTDKHFQSIEHLRTMISDIQAAIAPSVVDTIFLDYECWRPIEENDDVNAAIAAKLELVKGLFKQAWPDVTLIWGSYGAVYPASVPSGWSDRGYYPEQFVPEMGSIEWYYPWDLRGLRESYKRTVDRVAEVGLDQVQVTVPIGSGWQPKTLEPKRVWGFEYEYDLAFSWQMGQEINHPWFPQYPERFAPWDKSPTVMLWGVWDNRAPYWFDHFVAYVKGSHRLPLE